MRGAYKIHPLAQIFPAMSGQPWLDFIEDVRQHGIREPIVLYEGQVIDGRNRVYAADELALQGQPVAVPSYEIFDDPVGFVLSRNLHRRHLDEGQRAMVATKLATLEAHRPSYQEKGGKFAGLSQADAATMLQVSERTVRTARKVIEKAEPEIIEAVEQGKLAVSAAALAATFPEEAQRSIAAEAMAGHAPNVRAALKRNARAAKEADLGRKITALPDQQYGAILADPPWSFEVRSEGGMDRAADNHYPTMNLADIKALPVINLAAPDCALFLWTTPPFLAAALAVGEAWGFTYKTNAVWDKGRIGTGYWFRQRHEHLLLFTRGRPPAPAMGDQFSSVLYVEPTDHSAKPAAVHDMVRSYYPTVPKIELFARQRVPGFDAWGLEAPTGGK